MKAVSGLKSLRPVIVARVPAAVRLVRASRRITRLEPETSLVRSHVVPGTLAIDIGANEGGYTYHMAKAVGRRGQVLAVEPFRELADRVRRGARQLGLPVTVENYALSDRDGVVELFTPIVDGQLLHGWSSVTPHGFSEYGRTRVPMTSLDTLLADQSTPISFIKIDVEGHELEVLKGARQALERHWPTLLVEVESRHSEHPLEETFQFLEALGYIGSFLDAGSALRSISEFTIETHQRSGSSGDRERYVNNFLFRHSSQLAAS